MTNLMSGTETSIDNPFFCYTPVKGDAFADRERELGEILTSVRAGKSVVMHSQRKMGKTSILMELALRSSGDFISVYVDLRAVTSENRFVELLVKQTISASFPDMSDIVPAIWELVGSAKLRLVVLESGDLGLASRTDAPTITLIRSAIRTQEKDFGRQGWGLEIRMCSTCGAPMKWIEKYKRHYCYGCKKYAPRMRVQKLPVEGATATLPKRVCRECGGALSYIQSYGEFYCERCKEYSPAAPRRTEPVKLSDDEIAEALDLPNKIGGQKRKQLVVMFDEFQEILSFDSSRLLGLMASKLQGHRNACYIFSGNNWPQLRRIFEKRGEALHGFAHPIDLRTIPPEELEDFLMARFKLGRGKLTRDVAVRIVSVANGHPYYVQNLAHELMALSKTPTIEHADRAIEISLAKHALAYSSLLDSLRSPLQRSYLMAITLEPHARRGKDFIRRYGLKSRSHVQRIEKQLEAKGIASQGAITDPLFGLWLRNLATR